VNQLLKPTGFVTLLLLFICFRANAQSDLDPVHVTPKRGRETTRYCPVVNKDRHGSHSNNCGTRARTRDGHG
jgi:hypothetical protein